MSGRGSGISGASTSEGRRHLLTARPNLLLSSRATQAANRSATLAASLAASLVASLAATMAASLAASLAASWATLWPASLLAACSAAADLCWATGLCRSPSKGLGERGDACSGGAGCGPPRSGMKHGDSDSEEASRSGNNGRLRVLSCR